MLTERAVAYLQPLKFASTAERRTCFIPLSGIYWEDEIPDFHELMKMPDVDRRGIYRLLGIRLKIWDGLALSAEDREFWETARAQVSEYALFSRLVISEEDLALQKSIEKEVVKGFELMFADADEVKVTEKGGVQSYSATFDLTKEKGPAVAKKPWWRRLLGL